MCCDVDVCRQSAVLTQQWASHGSEFNARHGRVCNNNEKACWGGFHFHLMFIQGNTRHISTDSLIGIANGGYEDEKNKWGKRRGQVAADMKRWNIS